MVLNLFLALLLNSFNSEELKSKKEASQMRFPFVRKSLNFRYVNVYVCVSLCMCVGQSMLLKQKGKSLNISNYL